MGLARGPGLRDDPLRLARAGLPGLRRLTWRCFKDAAQKYGIELPDRQLACAPVHSPEGQEYLAAMRAAANYAWCNRQLLMWQAREVFARIFGKPWEELGMDLVYDVAHNIAKIEEHDVDGKSRRPVCVHRKGATRAFPPGHPEVPEPYRQDRPAGDHPRRHGHGAVGCWRGSRAAWSSRSAPRCHGAGRVMSRTAAVRRASGRRIDKELAALGIIARARGHKGLAEEQPAAYKDVDQVVDVVHKAGISKKVARLRPVGVIKG